MVANAFLAGMMLSATCPATVCSRSRLLGKRNASSPQHDFNVSSLRFCATVAGAAAALHAHTRASSVPRPLSRLLWTKSVRSCVKDASAMLNSRFRSCLRFDELASGVAPEQSLEGCCISGAILKTRMRPLYCSSASFHSPPLIKKLLRHCCSAFYSARPQRRRYLAAAAQACSRAHAAPLISQSRSIAEPIGPFHADHARLTLWSALAAVLTYSDRQCIPCVCPTTRGTRPALQSGANSQTAHSASCSHMLS